MSPYARLAPREGFCADFVLRILASTAFNPVLLLPLALAARLAGGALHPWASATLTALVSLSLAARANAWLTDKTRNNWVDDTYDWSKEIVLVTGGAEGIGGSMVRLLDDKGITVVVLDVRPMSFTTTPRVHHFLCDVRSPKRVNAVADEVKVKVGDPTVIINNAGVCRFQRILDAAPSYVRFTFDVNTLAHFWIAKAFLPSITAQNHGMVVTISSLAAWVGCSSMVDYGASKAASAVFSKGLATELADVAPKVRIVSVYPSHTETALAKGLDMDSRFFAPVMGPDYVAETVVKQVLTGRSAEVFMPRCAAAFRMLPEWLAVPIQAGIVAAAGGRPFVCDVDAPYDE